MLIVLGAILAAVVLVILLRLIRLSAPPSRRTLVTVAAAALVIGLALLAAAGRLHWLAVAAAALLPFLRRGVSLLGYLPLVRRLFGGSARADTRTAPGGGPMTRAQAIEVLGLGSRPSREEILSAHRHLMQKLHPDRGGSNYFAQQLNEAKRTLLDDSAGNRGASD